MSFRAPVVKLSELSPNEQALTRLVVKFGGRARARARFKAESSAGGTLWGGGRACSAAQDQLLLVLKG